MIGELGASSENLLQKAAAFRRLAFEILDGPFRQQLLALAQDYETEAQKTTATGRARSKLG